MNIRLFMKYRSDIKAPLGVLETPLVKRINTGFFGLYWLNAGLKSGSTSTNSFLKDICPDSLSILLFWMFMTSLGRWDVIIWPIATSTFTTVLPHSQNTSRGFVIPSSFPISTTIEILLLVEPIKLSISRQYW